MQPRYYIRSLDVSAERLLEVVRAHWSIENSLHWSMDVTFREDQSRVRKDHSPQNMATLRQISHNQLKRETSLRWASRATAASRMAEEYLLKVLLLKTRLPCPCLRPTSCRNRMKDPSLELVTDIPLPPKGSFPCARFLCHFSGAIKLRDELKLSSQPGYLSPQINRALKVESCQRYPPFYIGVLHSISQTQKQASPDVFVIWPEVVS